MAQNELPKTIQQALSSVQAILDRSFPQRSNLHEAEILVESVLRGQGQRPWSRMEFYSKGGEPISADAVALLFQWTQSRVEGVPLQYLTGRQVFLDHEYQVGPGVLIPRPETELLLMTAAQELSQCGSTLLTGLEIGIGSGVLSIELLYRFSALKMIASEYSERARHYAERNAEQILGAENLKKERLKLVQVKSPQEVGEVFLEELPLELADFLITNPPYLLSSQETEAEVFKNEPWEALFAPPEDPLYFYRRIADSAEKWIRPGGYVFAELPHERSTQIQLLFQKSKWKIQVLPDLNQRDRVLVAVLEGAK